VDDGHFTFHIVPGDPMNEVFDGDERWIQVQVKLILKDKESGEIVQRIKA
jgi:hypothetical protein